MSLPILTSKKVVFAKIMTGWIPFKVYRKLARAIMYMRVRINEVAGFVIDENGKKLGTINQMYNPPSSNKIRINHYAVKSYDEFIARGRQGDNDGRNTRTPDMFAARDTNDIYSPIMDKYIDRLKEM